MMIQKTSPLHPLVFLIEELRLTELSFKKLSNAIRKYADAPELAKAVHPEQTEIISHIKRLKLIQLEIGKPKEKSTATVSPLGLPKKLKKGEERDLWLIAQTQLLLQQKLAIYNAALEIAKHLHLANIISLVEQTIKENEATCTWLRRILFRVLNGESIVPIQQEIPLASSAS